jgi:hypothetical protein
MPIPLLALGAISALPGLFKAGNGISQLNKANKVTLQNTVPSAFMENLGMLRQDAATGTMPGFGMYANQLAQNQAATTAAIGRVASSPSAALSALGGADARRQQGMAGLNAQGQQYQQQARRALGTGLLQLGQYQKADQDTYSRTKAGFRQAGNVNLFGGISDLATNAAYFGSGAGQAAINGTATPTTLDQLTPRPSPGLFRNSQLLGLPGMLPRYDNSFSTQGRRTGSPYENY